MSSSDKTPPVTRKNHTLWEIWAIIAACLILLSPLLYKYRMSTQETLEEDTQAHFSGTQSCKKCHSDIYGKWQGSNHDRAMAEANEENVLGNFNNIIFTDPYTHKKSRFFKDGTKFKVETEGPDGMPGVFTVSHTFGFYPLQQYLIPFPGGRLQCLSIAWDIEKKQWYRLPPYDVQGPDDWLHWTKGGQNWNGMCAECHSTQLSKRYNLVKNEYSTTWFEINVGCEACHGPASHHVKWAQKQPLARTDIKNFGLEVTSSEMSPEKQIILCAPCHSRRYQLGDNNHDADELLDLMVPSLLSEALYHADGQIKEEVYVYGSYTQSKMYHKGVRCNDCHDVHSLKTFNNPSMNNDLCLQCHRASEYDSKKHHFHRKTFEGKASNGHLCVKCHMPGQYYMGIDYRPDHSLRIPRPDLSKKLGTPNSCSSKNCHDNKPLDWVVENYNKWYGLTRKPHYGEVFSAASKFEPEQDEKLRQLVSDGLLPEIVRATALSLLRNYPSPKNTEIFSSALASPDALLRHTALTVMTQPSQETILKQIAPKLYDPVKAVRLEAALMLAQVPIETIHEQDRQTLQETIEEYRTAMKYNSDFAPQRYNLGNLARAQGNSDKAMEYYHAAIDIDDFFFPAKVNLAMEFNQKGNNKEAEKLLRDVVDGNPRLYEISYSLGLLLAEMGNHEEAAKYLGRAADGMPGNSRVRYNQALALLKLKRWQEGADALEKAIFQDPAIEEYFVTLVKLYLNFRMNEKAHQLAKAVLEVVPDHKTAKEILSVMK